MSAACFRSLPTSAPGVVVEIDGRAVEIATGRSLLAGLLILGGAGAAADFFCAIGQCQRCAIRIDGRPGLACMTYPKGGERIETAPYEGRALPWE